MMPIPTQRLFLIALAGTGLFALVSVSSQFLLPAVIYSMSCLGATIMDLTQSRRLAAIEVQRQVDDRLAIGVENAVHLTIANNSTVPLRIKLRDVTPTLFQILTDHPRLFDEHVFSTAVHVQSHDIAVISYAVIPPKRGLFSFGPVVLRYTSLFGLLEIQRTISLSQDVKVYPNIRDIKAYELALRRGHLEMAGLRRSQRHGMGTEFERLRDYQSGDDYRRVNWPATARRHRPVTIDYQTERAQNVILALDIGRHMNTSIGVMTSLDYAINTCLLTAHICLSRGDRVALVVYADRVTHFLPLKSGKLQLQALLELLYNVASIPVESDYLGALAFIKHRFRQRSLVISFTDLVDRDASRSLSTMLSALHSLHIVVCATMRDPVIKQMSKQAPVTSSDVYQRAIALGLTQRRQALIDTLKTAGIMPVDVDADELSPRIIDTYLELKSHERI